MQILSKNHEVCNITNLPVRISKILPEISLATQTCCCPFTFPVKPTASGIPRQSSGQVVARTKTIVQVLHTMQALLKHSICINDCKGFKKMFYPLNLLVFFRQFANS